MLALKVDKGDATRIWSYFDRFALYDDLKSLYSKCVPQLAKFEQKIMDFELAIEQAKMVVRGFDEGLSMKSNKSSIAALYDHISIQCARKGDLAQFQEEATR